MIMSDSTGDIHDAIMAANGRFMDAFSRGDT